MVQVDSGLELCCGSFLLLLLLLLFLGVPSLGKVSVGEKR